MLLPTRALPVYTASRCRRARPHRGWRRSTRARSRRRRSARPALAATRARARRARAGRLRQTRERRRTLRPGARSSERLLVPPALVEDRHRLVAGTPRMLDRSSDVAADVLWFVGVRGECDRHPASVTGLEQRRVGIQLAHRLVQPGRGHLDADPGRLDGVGSLLVEPVQALSVRARAVVLDQVGMRKGIEQPAPRRASQPDEVAPRGLVRAELLDQTRLLVVWQAVDEVDRPQQVVPRIRRECLGRLSLSPDEVVHLHPELDRQPALLGLDHSTHVPVDVVAAALDHEGLVPELTGLLEVVDVLREADLVDVSFRGGLDEALDRLDGEVDLTGGVAQVHVVIDDHKNEETSSRSPWSVTLSSLWSPGTTVTRPPRASTSAAQSVAPASSPASASRRTGATNACGVCTATSSSRGSVSTTWPPWTRLTVSASGNPGTAPSQPSLRARRTRSITSSGRTDRATSWTTITSASAATSVTH